MQTPASVTALSGAQLERQGIGTMQALAATVPNVNISSYFLTDAIYIRGIGNGGLQAGFEQQAGLFIDGLYFGNGNWISGGMVDVETRSEEHTSELQSLMRISYAVFCLKKNNHTKITS